MSSQREEAATVTQLPWEPSVGFAARLRLVRIEYGNRIGQETQFSQAQMAALLGEKAGTYGGWESGNSKPADLLGVARKVREATGASAAWLLGVRETAAETEPGQDIHYSGCNDGSARRLVALADLFELPDAS